MTTQCENCGEHLTDRYARVFGDINDVVHGCMHCRTHGDVQDGSAAGLDG